MRKILALFLILMTQTSFSQVVDDEAIILNEEMQFLENSAQKTKSTNLPGSYQAETSPRKRVIKEESLEKTYFKETSEDAVSSRLASPRKKRN